MTQALAFIPETDIIYGLKTLQTFTKKNAQNFEVVLNWFETNYIGSLKPLSQSARLVPKFPVSLWNLYNIVLLELGRSNNAVESWHGTITSDQQSHINLNKLIELFRLEQSNTENWLANLEKGTVHKRKTKAIMKDLAILNLVKTYKIENMAEYLEFMSLNMN